MRRKGSDGDEQRDGGGAPRGSIGGVLERGDGAATARDRAERSSGGDNDARRLGGLRRRCGEKCNISKSVADQPTWTAYVAFVAILLLIMQHIKICR
ncbi:hypothetical protein Scep_023907 [Stephania cephalantha]|uniref:Uncharacterized protein n=1 Tax=Stephania cephalantha TaxID=152367 RepID=A0AAP0EYG1_9MAGN